MIDPSKPLTTRCKVCGSTLRLRAETHSGTFRMIYETLCQRCQIWYHTYAHRNRVRQLDEMFHAK